jgi:hypothetical protein
MPIRLFQDGEVLDAADVNTYFMDQALVVFEDETERDGAFGGPDEPSLDGKEGRICYLKSDQTIYIYNGSTWTAQLANIEDGTITTAKLDGTSGSEAVTTAKIRAGAVTEAKIGTGAVTEAKIGTGAVTEAKIGTGAVTSDKIADGAIVNTDINASAAIALTKLGTGSLPTTITITSDNIVNGTIVNDDINSSAAIAQSKISGLSTSLASKLDATATAVNSSKIDGRTVFVQQDTPTANATGDIWFQVTGL